jgi:gliding motility-associated protein GldE
LILDIVGILHPQFSLSLVFISEVFSLIGLLLIAGFISGSETAFFSITQVQILDLKDSSDTKEKYIHSLLNTPKRLLATLLISVNFVNIATVVLSTLITARLFDLESNPGLAFLLQVIVVTFVIVLFCEVMPKVYATQNSLRFAKGAAIPVYFLDTILRPLSWLLVSSTSIVDKYINKKGYDISVDELSHAIDITSDKDTPEEEKKILKGIARFGNIDVKQIMKSRMDILAFEVSEPFDEIIPKILENRYSRIPVYEDSLDHVKGVLYIKDLLPYLDAREADFRWQSLLRPAYFVPESKKINDLLKEFQEKKMHLSVVVDEYGGISGIVTLEDILEEIVGEINDEFDDDELFYSKLDDYNFVFEGKTLLNDVCRVMEVDRSLFAIENEEVETLAGLILELHGSIPHKNEKLKLNGVTFTIESADRKRIKRVKIGLPVSEQTHHEINNE